jgi:ABC-type phosphate/phosphonate transport system substrate-binding protein
MRRNIKGLAFMALVVTVAACTKTDKTVDSGFDAKDLSTLKAGIWVDPNGCDQWIIDDGFEGYLSARLDRNGKPVCSGVAPPNTAVGPFKKGSGVPDLI